MLGIFLSEKIRWLQSGANPRSWVPETSMLTTRPPKPLISKGLWPLIYQIWTHSIFVPVGILKTNCTVIIFTLKMIWKYSGFNTFNIQTEIWHAINSLFVTWHFYRQYKTRSSTLFNPLPLLFKTLLHGQKLFFRQHLNLCTTPDF
jgi:hypothetical protein